MFVGHYAVGFTLKKRIIILMLFLSMGFVGMFFAPEAEATPAAASIMSLTLYAVFTSMAFWSDRKIRGQETASNPMHGMIH